VRTIRTSRFRRGVTYSGPGLGVLVGTLALFGVAGAGASIATLTPGHPYCYYFSSTGRSGGMHLVAATPTVIAAGPSNYISGVGGDPQDTVFYIDCTSGAGRVGGDAYVGLPRMAMHRSGNHYAFNDQFVIHGIRHLGTRSNATTTASIAITGTLAEGVINGTVHVSAAGCLPAPLVIHYAGR
jgi:hypothetical protein